ncbi:DUF3261 domain-containing protein [Polynucleobacter sp. MG-27-Goln-C1]|uniref:DUF3261 domain-containing protein n=1 Tax=Polynucleobacter sp. MG-27-Goln-C1 TaxID=1819726 RepID=UPI001C0E848E|nr:DUF3261 domain-containing protein [Polynucleobacter sp. MG-27-Goln-C1]
MSNHLIIRLLGMLLTVLALSSCSTVFLNDSDGTSLNALGEPRILEMQMHLIRGSDSYTMDLVVEVRKSGLTVVGSSFGVRVFTLSYDGAVIAEGTGAGLPFYVPNQLILDDVILALSSRQSLESNLPKNCQLVRDGDVGKIYCDERLLVNITHQKTANKNNLVLVERFQPEYKVNFVISEVK